MNCILIIDDEALVRKTLRRLLEKNKFDVLEAENGNQALEIFKNNRPKIVITDLFMPEKEGLETIQNLKSINPDVKIIAISGGGIVNPETCLYMAKKMGAVKTFTKPIDQNKLITTIEEIIENLQ